MMIVASALLASVIATGALSKSDEVPSDVFGEDVMVLSDNEPVWKMRQQRNDASRATRQERRTINRTTRQTNRTNYRQSRQSLSEKRMQLTDEQKELRDAEIEERREEEERRLRRFE